MGKIGFEVFTAKNVGTKTFEGLTVLLGELQSKLEKSTNDMDKGLHLDVGLFIKF